jgi:cysteine dioxygenase
MYQLVYNSNKLQYIKYNVTLFNRNVCLIKWLPNSKTILHGHNGKDCSVYILNGRLKETVYNKNVKIKSHILHPYSKAFINDTIGKHIVENVNSKNTFSLHYYR